MRGRFEPTCKTFRAIQLILIGTLALTNLSGCTSKAPRENLERQLDRMIGNIASRELQGENVSCIERNLGCGCMYVSENCRIWFTVDQQTERITEWQYAGQPEDCWRNWHGYQLRHRDGMWRLQSSMRLIPIPSLPQPHFQRHLQLRDMAHVIAQLFFHVMQFRLRHFEHKFVVHLHDES